MIKHTLFIVMLLIFSCCFISCSDSATSSESNGENQPAEITQTSVPDSMKIPQPGYFNRGLVEAWVSDPDGLADIDSVYFYSLKPDGNYANGGFPLTMVDNGLPFNISDPWEKAGDENAGDGIFSLSIVLDINAQTGTYYFTFYAKDKAGNLSESKIDSVEVYSE